jgi:spermidine/putrescine-binding protein
MKQALKKTFAITLFTVCCLFITAASADENTVRVYTLRYQIAESLLPTINNILLSGESINAYNNELVVNASSAVRTMLHNCCKCWINPYAVS